MSNVKPALAANPTATMTAPGSGTIRTFPTITGTAADADGDLSMVKVLILRKVPTAGNMDRIDFWNGTAWREAMTITDGDAPTAAEIQQIIATRILEVPFVTISGASANWSYPPASGQTLPSGLNLTDGTYYVGAAAIDQGFRYGIAVPRTGGLFVTLTKLSPPLRDVVTPTGTLYPPSGLYRRFPTVSGTASDNIGVEKVHIGIVRRGVRGARSWYEYWNGTTFVAPRSQPAGVLTPEQIANFVAPYIASLPTAAITSLDTKTKRWSYNDLPQENGTYYLAVAIYDRAGNRRVLPGAPGYINTITVGNASSGGVTVQGKIMQPGRGRPVGLGNIPVFLLPGDIFSTVFMEDGLDLIVRTTSSTSTAVSETGNYVFTGVPPGNYMVLPAFPGNYFNPLRKTITVGTTNISNADFTLVGSDRDAPGVKITEPRHDSSHASIATVTGITKDTGNSRLLGVGLALYSLPGRGATTPNGIYNWRTNSFDTSVSLDAGLLKIARLSGLTSTAWSVELPNLPPGSYRLWVIAADGAFNLGGRGRNVAVTQDFTISARVPVPR